MRNFISLYLILCLHVIEYSRLILSLFSLTVCVAILRVCNIVDSRCIGSGTSSGNGSSTSSSGDILFPVIEYSRLILSLFSLTVCVAILRVCNIVDSRCIGSGTSSGNGSSTSSSGDILFPGTRGGTPYSK
ncbi:hypothetical protein GQ54DRAFT_311587 [Martensiomyces pterosporus]|nr:hypothetical protein GQ54DRAFT_311587 [Martensiomyces pterosporus]